jgi:hypothetical protein
MSNEQHPINPFKDYESGGIAVAGFFMVGLGAGLFYRPLWFGVLAGSIIGTGVGLLAMAWLSRDRIK